MLDVCILAPEEVVGVQVKTVCMCRLKAAALVYLSPGNAGTTPPTGTAACWLKRAISSSDVH